MFAKKVDLYEALQKPEHHWAEEIAHLRELNRIRNKLAHQLPSMPGHHADVKKWACSVVGYRPKTINRRVTYRRIVLKAFYLLTGTRIIDGQRRRLVRRHIGPAFLVSSALVENRADGFSLHHRDGAGERRAARDARARPPEERVLLRRNRG